ncbi:MAG: DUF2461 domain-containing protein [Acidobacteria bacterium]|nr:DUF2461 domain-containing protein [Acidobacteriota bacterium]
MFTDRTLSFLRRLKRHNRRDWFNSHRDEYERHVRAPMIAVVERLARDLPSIAPGLVVSPRVSIYRIHRDIRFTEDQSPYKTHVAAVFPCRGLPKHAGAGLYFEVSPDRVLVAGGMYAPTPLDLQRVREHLAANALHFRAIVESPGFRTGFGEVGGRRLKRVPRGFPPDHPAAEYLKLQQFLAGREHPSTIATRRTFYKSLLNDFARLAPLVRFLNEPLLAGTDGTTERRHQSRR